jgi:hypothetical protein
MRNEVNLSDGGVKAAAGGVRSHPVTPVTLRMVSLTLQPSLPPRPLVFADRKLESPSPVVVSFLLPTLCACPMPPSEDFQFLSASYFADNHDITGTGPRSNSLKEPLSKGVTITFHVHPEAHCKQLPLLLRCV